MILGGASWHDIDEGVKSLIVDEGGKKLLTARFVPGAGWKLAAHNEDGSTTVLGTMKTTEWEAARKQAEHVLTYALSQRAGAEPTPEIKTYRPGDKP